MWGGGGICFVMLLATLNAASAYAVPVNVVMCANAAHLFRCPLHAAQKDEMNADFPHVHHLIRF